MPGLSGRMSTVVKAKISHLLDRAEDPAETLDYSYEKQLKERPEDVTARDRGHRDGQEAAAAA